MKSLLCLFFGVILASVGVQGFIFPLSTEHTASRISRFSVALDNEGMVETGSRRAFLSTGLMAGLTFAVAPQTSSAATDTAAWVQDLEVSSKNLEAIPDLLEKQDWDAVRTILKTPPVNQLWNMGDAKNPLSLLAKATDEFELIELKDELSLSLQMCDQLTYDNVFVYFQPGSGKIKIKEPKDLSLKAMSQLSAAIDMAKSAI